MKYLLTVCVLLLSFGKSLGYCYMSQQVGEHCTTSHGAVMQVGEDLTLHQQCEKCSCRQESSGNLTMGCCGFGIHAGVFAAPPGCKIIADTDGCTPKLVRVDNEMEAC